VGHLRRGGGGARNQFGLDFYEAGKTWTKELCEKDSDGDGRTNGEELGDPQCLWSEGDIPQFNKGITHPGFGNPGQMDTVDSCENYQLSTGSKSTNFTFTDYQVMSKDTSYLKQAFTFPEEASILRFDIINNQPSVVHHMILYACKSDVSSTFGTPQEGGMPCEDVIFAWAVGGKDYCMPEGYGNLIKSNARYMALEIHYDNPQGHSNILDSSGLQIHYMPGQTVTPISWLWVGANLPQLSIPPGKKSYEIKAVCDLSQELPDGYTGGPITINLFAGFLHGHSIATKIWVTKRRKDSSDDETDISCNSNYDFDLQELVPFSPVLEVTTEDVLTIHCVFDSSAKTTVTKGGDATSEEMCVGLFMFYPARTAGLKCWSQPQVEGDGSKKCVDLDNPTTTTGAPTTADAPTTAGDSNGPDENSCQGTHVSILSITLVMMTVFIPN